MRRGRVCADPGPRSAAWAGGAAVRAEAPPSCDRTPMLTVEFHSVSTGLGRGCPHSDRHPGWIVARRSPLELTVFGVVAGSSDSRPSRRTRLIVCRHSPPKFTVFRVVSGRSVHIRMGTLVRARAAAHH